jgi:hypothetical protein
MIPDDGNELIVEDGNTYSNNELKGDNEAGIDSEVEDDKSDPNNDLKGDDEDAID